MVVEGRDAAVAGMAMPDPQRLVGLADATVPLNFGHGVGQTLGVAGLDFYLRVEVAVDLQFPEILVTHHAVHPLLSPCQFAQHQLQILSGDL
jgi:hypothetical protein